MIFRGPFHPKQFCESIIQFRTLKELEKTCDGVNEVTGGLHGELYTLTGQQSTVSSSRTLPSTALQGPHCLS